MYTCMYTGTWRQFSFNACLDVCKLPGLLLPANHFDSARQIKVGPCINGDGCATAIPTSLDSWETSACSRPRKPQPTWSCPPGSCAPGGKTWSFTLIWLNFLETSFVPQNLYPKMLCQISWQISSVPQVLQFLARARLWESGSDIGSITPADSPQQQIRPQQLVFHWINWFAATIPIAWCCSRFHGKSSLAGLRTFQVVPGLGCPSGGCGCNQQSCDTGGNNQDEMWIVSILPLREMNQSKDGDTYTSFETWNHQKNCCDMTMLHKLVTRTSMQPEIPSFSGPHFKWETTWNVHPTLDKARDATNPHLTQLTGKGISETARNLGDLNGAHGAWPLSAALLNDTCELELHRIKKKQLKPWWNLMEWIYKLESDPICLGRSCHGGFDAVFYGAFCDGSTRGPLPPLKKPWRHNLGWNQTVESQKATQWASLQSPEKSETSWNFMKIWQRVLPKNAHL